MLCNAASIWKIICPQRSTDGSNQRNELRRIIIIYSGNGLTHNEVSLCIIYFIVISCYCADHGGRAV
jgi:hypothetical protein